MAPFSSNDPTSSPPSEVEMLRRQLAEAERALADTRRELEQVKRREQDLEDFVENGTVGLHWVAADGTILWANKAELDLLGYTSDEYVGRHIAEFHADQEVIEDILQRLTCNQTLSSYEARLRAKDGSVKTVLISSNVLWEGAKFVRTRCFTRDITELKAAEEARQQFEALRQAETLKDQFVSILSHELRTPLNAITGFASILADEIPGPLTDEQHRYLNKIEGGADILLALIEDLLDLSRIQAGKFTIEPVAMQVSALAGQIVSHLEPLVQRAGLSLDVQVPDALPALEADPKRISQVLINLLNNAIKFTPPGGRITLSARADTGHLRCEVRDTGPGIAEKDLPRLFFRFTQLDMSNTRAKGGTGLGLSICKAIVEAHGGSIGMESEVGAGASFWFSLPYNQAGGEPGFRESAP